jgi:hypothetical protein
MWHVLRSCCVRAWGSRIGRWYVCGSRSLQGEAGIALEAKLIVFNGEDFGYWKNRTRNYLLSHGHTIWEIVQEAYVITDTLDHATQGELQRYENNYKVLNLITTALGRNVYDRVAHLEMARDVWLKLCNTYESTSEIKSSRRDTYNR